MKILVTGISGFVGSHLAEYLLSLGHEVHGTVRHRSNLENILHIKDKLKLHDCNILDATSVEQTVKEVKPDILHHLAAQSFVPTSWKSPNDTCNTNINGTINVLEAIREHAKDCVVHICGTSEEYGLVHPNECPITELNPLRPQSPYGVSKVACDLFGQQYHRSYGLKTVITRAFNHTGPRRGEVFVTSAFAKQVIELSLGRIEIIKVGNLSAQRDFTDVRDVVKAYWLLVNKGKYGDVYNVCSGKSVTMKWLLDIMLKFIPATSDFDRYPLIELDPLRMRPSDVPILLGCYDKIKDLGWEPKIPLAKTIEDLLNYWRERLK